MLMSAFVLMQSCTDVKNEPITPGNDIPKQVSNIEWVATPGGAEISYTIPADPSLLYVEAVYTLKSGEVRNVKASFYQNKLNIEGLADTNPCKVEIFSVGRNAKRSEPKRLEITPLEAPYMTVFNTIAMERTFGGVRVTFTNEHEANLAIMVITTDENGEYVPADTYYSKSKKGDFSVRGFEPVEREFGVCIRDQWQNKTDTIFVTLTPIFEKEIDKKNFKKVDLPGSTHDGHISTKIEGIWDGSTADATASIFHTKPGSGIPQWMTIDMGVEAQLSRFTLHHRPRKATDGIYTAGAPKKWELWGSNDPDLDGGFENWIHLGSFESYKPSGLPMGEVTDEDFAHAVTNGESCEILAGSPSVRYVRLMVTQVYGPVDYIYLGELTFYGNDELEEPAPEEPGTDDTATN